MSKQAFPSSINSYPRVLSIAGSDSSGGAGIQADLKTFSALGCYGMTAITALTAQNTQGVRAIHSVPPQMLRDQIDAVVEDIGVDAVKIGMLHSPEIVETVAAALDAHQLTKVVLDPVMVAANGAKLISDEAVAVLVERLFPRALVVTPNLDEAALLLGRPLTDTGELELAAQQLLEQGAKAILLKGGHLPGHDVIDILARAGSSGQVCELLKLHSLRISTHNLHGTGCTLSSAIAAYLALRFDLADAVQAARIYVRSALYAGSHVRTGAGVGPLNHGFAPQAMQVREI
ncbi:bifunctional hydroxymethylpyrimidine kinase/phosphomethylpyrimidine kinase [Methylobacillus caricis]|uniref:bifunctional hydroxymethylpyrimidine kinase/phosphomethylpyrimidine kinase n=1 Tax=Methylobacillus caricis TaxID=1971611 RepID=UPI001CFF7483|nr:bifunctional hydroxymethylpyrimidine kinase/phosphomethylpyrimidine kinase [Methylobacillus caricis]MCB5186976.1 bifunctional hydroxymethylpyrimidine kinase/phosphomethylpyrimidine kinase [Methylobacillus caricis]